MRTRAERRADAQRANLGDFFFTQMGTVERTPEYVRLIFFSDRQTIAIALPVSTFQAAMARLIAMCPDDALH